MHKILTKNLKTITYIIKPNFSTIPYCKYPYKFGGLSDT